MAKQIIIEYLDNLMKSPDDIGIPISFEGAGNVPQDGKYSGTHGGIRGNEVRPALNIISPATLFISYVDEYIRDPQLFQKPGVIASVKSFINILNQFLEETADSFNEASGYYEPDWKPVEDLSGVNLLQKSTPAQKLHAVDAIIENPAMLIGYAVLSAAFHDFFDTQIEYFARDKPSDALPINWARAKGAATVVHGVLSQTGKPDIGIVHGPVVQSYFHQLQRGVNHGGFFAQFSPIDVNEHVQSLGLSRMFQSATKECPIKQIFIAAAAGASKRGGANQLNDAHIREQRLWMVYARAIVEASDLQVLIVGSLRPSFDDAIMSLPQDFKRPVMSPPHKPSADLSGGQS